MAYNFGHKYRGRALIFANEFKGQRKCQRKGCIEDIKMMKELFERLDFRVTVYKDLTAANMISKMEAASEDPLNKDSDCLAVVISSHGTEFKEKKLANSGSGQQIDTWYNAVYANDLQLVYIDEVLEIFNKSESLKEKPKLFFIEACRSRNLSNSVDDLIRKNTYDPGQTIPVVDPGGTIACQSNSKSSTDSIYTCDVNKDVEDIYGDVAKDPDEWVTTLDTNSLVNVSTYDKSEGATFGVDVEDASGSRELEASSSTSAMGASGSRLDAGGSTPAEDAAGSRDQEDTRAGSSGSQLPAEFTDIAPTHCPDDFLIMYPIMSGKAAFRNPDTGSYMMQYLHKEKNVASLLRGDNLLQYLCRVCKDLADYEYKPDVDDLSLEKIRNILIQSIKHLSHLEQREMLQEILGDIPKEEVITEQVLKHYFDGLTDSKADQERVGRMKQILSMILPFKTTGCVVHRLKGEIKFHKAKGVNTKMAFAVRYAQETLV